MTIEQIAQVCHEAIRAFCQSIGDHSLPPWADAPDWQKSSTFNSVQFHLGHPDAPASSSHDAWLKEKLDSGWRYGPVKNPETREHPCIVPFEELPPPEQAKDHLFRAVVGALAPFIAD